MKKLMIVSVIVGLCIGQVLAAENEKEEGKKTPPGLQKKGAVPPGQAKKKGQADEAAPTATPAPASTPAAAPAPASTPTPAAAPAPAPAAATTVNARTPATTTKPAATPAKLSLQEQKALIDVNMRTINQATKSNPAMHKIALQHIAKETGVTLETLKEQDKIPDATDTALLLGNFIAKQSGAKFRDIYNARENGKHWAEIAKAHNVDVSLVAEKSSHLAQALRAAQAR